MQPHTRSAGRNRWSGPRAVCRSKERISKRRGGRGGSFPEEPGGWREGGRREQGERAGKKECRGGSLLFRKGGRKVEARRGTTSLGNEVSVTFLLTVRTPGPDQGLPDAGLPRGTPGLPRGTPDPLCPPEAPPRRGAAAPSRCPGPCRWLWALAMAFRGLCPGHRCFPRDFKEVHEQIFGMASTAPLLLTHKPVHAGKPPVVSASPRPPGVRAVCWLHV